MNNASTFQLKYTTPKAEKEFAALDRRWQDATRELLSRPIPKCKCQKIKRLASYGISHIDITESLRASFTQGNNPTLLNLGIHSVFDRFAKTFNGNVSGRVIPIGESIIMKETTNKQNNSTTATPTAAEAESVVIDSLPPSDSDAPEDLVMKGLKKMVQSHSDAALGLLTEKENDVTKVKADIAALQDQVSNLKEVNNQLRRTDESVDQLLRQIHNKFSSLSQRFDEVQNQFKKMCLAFETDQKRPKALAEDLVEIRNQIVEHQQAHEDSIEEVKNELSQHIEVIVGRINSKVITLQAGMANSMAEFKLEVNQLVSEAQDGIRETNSQVTCVEVALGATQNQLDAIIAGQKKIDKKVKCHDQQLEIHTRELTIHGQIHSELTLQIEDTVEGQKRLQNDVGMIGNRVDHTASSMEELRAKFTKSHWLMRLSRVVVGKLSFRKQK